MATVVRLVSICNGPAVFPSPSLRGQRRRCPIGHKCPQLAKQRAVNEAKKHDQELQHCSSTSSSTTEPPSPLVQPLRPASLPLTGSGAWPLPDRWLLALCSGCRLHRRDQASPQLQLHPQLLSCRPSPSRCSEFTPSHPPSNCASLTVRTVAVPSCRQARDTVLQRPSTARPLMGPRALARCSNGDSPRPPSRRAPC